MRSRTIRLLAAALLGAPAPAAADLLGLLAADDAAIAGMGSVGGLAGYHVTPAGEEEGYTLYVTGEGYAVVGLLYDPQGLLLTADQLAALATPAPPASAASPAPPAETRAAGGFVVGTTGPGLRVYADPACPFSRETVARLAAAALEGRLVLEVIPVALLGAESAGLALAADGAEAWFARRTADPDPESAARVRANNALFRAAGGTAVPLLVWEDASGARQARTGSVLDVAALLSEIAP